MERVLKKAHKTYSLARRQILYRMMYETSKNKICARILLCVHLKNSLLKNRTYLFGSVRQTMRQICIQL